MKLLIGIVGAVLASLSAYGQVDLTVTNLNTTGIVTDTQSLVISGTLGASIRNLGTAPVSTPFRVLAWEDRNNNLLREASEPVLGSLVFSAGLTPGTEAAIQIPIAGSVLFRGNVIAVKADSDDALLETHEDNNTKTTTDGSQYIPPPSVFSPVLKWSWTSSTRQPSALNVMTPPTVIDINGDGKPDILFGSTPLTDGALIESGYLRALDGATGQELFTIDQTTPVDLRINTACSLAVGDIDNDGRPEIIACDASGNRLIAFENDGTFKWRSPNLDVTGWGAPSLADLDHDGTPEIIFGRQVLDSTGSLRWTGTGTAAAIGLGPLSVVSDVDLDGELEIVAGPTIYSAQGAVKYRNQSLPDGLNAVGNFDSDPQAEIVLVSGGKVWLLNHDLSIKWGPVNIPGGGSGGPPTIADFDNDGEPEIGVAGATRYAVFETNGTLRWATPIQDASSNVTGSSVFDFEGDGSAEAVYRDELFLYIFRGTDGTVLFKTPLSSCTWFEYPVIADVTGDGRAEIITGANNNCGKGPNRGLFVFGDSLNNWVRTRAIWNQHSYHITNVNDDGTIPTHEQPNWLQPGLNNFRLNAFIQPEKATVAPDLTSSFIRKNDIAFPTAVTLTARIGNGGGQNNATNLITNGGFELSNPVCPSSGALEQIAPGSQALSGWTITQGTVDVLSSTYQPFQGRCSLDLDGSPGIGGIEQTIQTVAGHDYVLRFALAGNPDLTPRVKRLEVSIGSVVKVFEFDVAATSRENMAWKVEEIPFSATTNLTSVRFTSLTESGGLSGPTLDAVELREAEGFYSEHLSVSFYRGDPISGGTLLGTAKTAKALASGEFEDVSIVWTNPAPGLHPIVVVADPSNLVNEGDETNNKATANILLGGGPFLTVDDLITRFKSQSVDIRWSAIAGATSYNIYRRTGTGAPVLVKQGVTGTAFSDTGLTNGVVYYYSVRWLNAQGQESGDGTEASATPIAIPTIDTPPTISSVPVVRAKTLVPYTYQVRATDPDKGEVLTYALMSPPAGMAISASGLITWVPSIDQAGYSRVQIRVTDTRGRIATQSYALFTEVTIVDNQPPTVSAGPNQTIVRGTELLVGSYLTTNGPLPDPVPPTGVLRYDGATGAPIGPLALYWRGSVPWGDAIRTMEGPDKRWYVIVGNSPSMDPYHMAVLRYDEVSGKFLNVFVPFDAGGLTDQTMGVFGPDGNLYMPDFRRRNVHRFNGSTGEYMGVFATPPFSNALPRDAIFGPDGNLYVGDFGAQILKFDGKTGAYISEFTSFTRLGRDRIFSPHFHPDGTLYTLSATAGGYSIIRINGSTGAYIDEIVHPVSSDRPGFIDRPGDFTFGPDGDIYVATGPIGSVYVPGKVLRFDGKTGAYVGDFVPPLSGGLTGAGGVSFFKTGAPATLAGAVSDDGPSSALKLQWSKVSGPGNVTFADPASATTTADFSSVGTYVLKLTADDGSLTASSEVTIVATHQNRAPVVDAGVDFSVVLPATASLNGRVADDDLAPGGPLTYSWTKQSGPGVVTFFSPSAVSTNAAFGAPGTYVLRLSVSDGVYMTDDDVSVTVTGTAPSFSLVPNSGGQGSLGLSVAVTGQLTHFVQGTTTASFGAGISVVSLTVTSATSATALLNIDPLTAPGPRKVTVTTGTEVATLANGFTVIIGNQPPTVSAGPDQTVVRGTELLVSSYLTSNGPLDPIPPTGVLRYDGATGAPIGPLALYWRGSSPYGNPIRTMEGPDKRWYVIVGNWPSVAPYHTAVLRYDEASGKFLNVFVPFDAGGLNDQTMGVFGPDGNLYLPDFRRRNVHRFNGSTGEYIGVFATPPFSNALPRDAVFGPDGNLYVGEFEARITKFDGKTGAYISEFTSAALLGRMTISSPHFHPDGTLYALSARAGGNTVIRLNGSTGDFIDEIVHPGFIDRPDDFTFGPDGDIYVGTIPLGNQYVPGKVLRFDGKTGAYVGEFVPPLSGGLTGAGGLSFFKTGAPATLAGVVSDDGPSSALTLQWSKVSGPGDVTFADPASATTTADFSRVGTYVLRLTADDGSLTSSSEVTIVATHQNRVPVVDAGVDFTVVLPATASLTGRVVDDNLAPGGPLTYSWTKQSGSGSVTFSSPNAVATNASFGAPGTYVLRLSVSDGVYTTDDDVSVTVTGIAPSFSLVPNSGGQGALGLSVAITGQLTHFVQGATTANFGSGITVVSLTVNGSTAATAVINIDLAASLGLRTVTVTTGSEVTSLFNGFTITPVTIPVPSISQVSPNAGQQGQGGPLGVVGLNTHFVQGVTTLDLGPGITVSSVTVTCATCLTAQVSLAENAAVGPRTVTATTGTETPQLVNGFTILAGTPILTSMNPAAGRQGKSVTSTITGKFTHWVQGTTTVNLGAGVTVNSVTVSTPTSLTVQLSVDPSAILGLRDLTVTTGTEVVSAPNVFNVLPGVPAISQVSPNFGQQGQSSIPVAITGQFSHFVQGTSQVSFGAGITVNSVSVSSATSLTANISIASNASTGFRTVAVTTSAEVVSAANAFTVLPSGPTLEDIDPNAGQPGQSGPITITGLSTHFVQGTSQVSFGAGITVGTVTVASSTSLTAQITITAGAAVGNRTVSVTTGSEVALMTNGFTVQAGDPFLTIVSPGGGQQGQSLPVMLTGQFTNWVRGTTTADFGAGITVNSVAVADATHLTAQVTIAADATIASRVVTITTGAEVESAEDAFDVVASGPRLISATPNTGTQGQTNLSVAIVGFNTHFVQGTSQITFGSTAVVVNSVTVSDATHLTANISIAINASSAPRTIVVTTGNEVATLPNGFTVNPATNQAPVIIIDPTWSVALPNRLTLAYTVTDDGLPNGGALTVSWETISQPAGAEVGFQDQTTTSISAGFSIPGTYTLRITATDSLLSATKDVVVTVTGATGPPATVSIASPTEGTEITGPVNVTGSVTSANLVSWTLEFKPIEETAYRTLATGTTTVSNGILGVFDPTILLNGIVQIRLTATTVGGQTTTAGPINVVLTKNQKIGNFTVSFNDLSVSLPGIPIQVVRTYDSRSRYMKDFGAGWSLDLRTVRLNENIIAGSGWQQTSSGGNFPTYCMQATKPHVVTASLPDGTTYTFDLTVSPQCQQLVPIDQVTFGFSARPGTNANLSMIGDNRATISGGIPGPVDLFDIDTSQLFDANLYRITLPDGRTLRVSQITGGLEQMTDLNGNTVMVTANGIFHSSGTSVAFQRDVSGRITQITDPAGNALHYTYSSTGDLFQFQDRESNTTTFTYDNSHGLLTIVDPRGIQPIKNVYDGAGRLTEHIDAFGKSIHYTHSIGTKQEIVEDRLGNTTVNEYDNDGNVVKVTDALGGETERTYDSHGNVKTEKNPLGKTRTYTYDGQDNRLTEVDSLGHTTTYTYNGFQQVATITDARGGKTTNEYDLKGNLTSTTDALGFKTTYTNTAAGLQESMTDALHHTTSYVYDSSGNLKQQTDPLGHITTFTYDSNGNKKTETRSRTTSSGPETLVTTYDYDKENRLTKTTFPDGSTTQIIYNAIGKQSAAIDPLSRQTTYTYDEMGRLTKTTFPDNLSETSTYDAEGRRISSTDRANRMTSYEYDKLGRLIKVTFVDGAQNQTDYDLAGQVTQVTDALGHPKKYFYDDAGRRTKVTDALNHDTAFEYDEVGNQKSMTDANAHMTRFQYDALNRRSTTIYADTTFDQVGYDELGRTISKTDQAGKKTQFQFDELGRLVRVNDALNQTTAYSYDELGNRISQTDANSHTTGFDYDKLGRRITRTLPLGMSEASTYDFAGNLKTKTDFNGRMTTYDYDPVNRLTSRFPAASFGEPSVVFTYTATGQRLSMTDASGATAYEYDQRDRLKMKTTPHGTLSYTYDLAGNLKGIRSSNVGGASVDYAYDELNRLAAAKDNLAGGGTTTYAYDNAGNLQSYLYPNGVQHAYIYDPLNHLKNLTVNHGASTLASYTYTLGPSGNRTNVAELGGRQVAYTYDDLYRLKSETITGGSVNGTIGYNYDAVGNRQQRTSTVVPVPAVSYGYDANDRLTTDNYDQNGSTIGSGGVIYAYDSENHLVSQNGGAVSIVYDGDGNRIAKTVGGITTRYLVDDRNLTGYAQVLEELSGGTVQRVYTYGLDLISQSQSSGASFYGYDGHGNVRLLVDTTAVVTDRYDYDAFGIQLESIGTTRNDYRYAGEQLESTLDWYYLRSRYLSPVNGRFATADAFPGIQRSPISLNRYLYTSANPVNLIDPSGLLSVPELTAAVTINNILGRIWLTHLVFPAIVVTIEISIFKPGFAAHNGAIELAANTTDPMVIMAANDLYDAGNQLIILGSKTISLGKDLADLLGAISGIKKATKGVVDSIGDPYAAAGKSTLLLTKLLDLFSKTNNSLNSMRALLDLHQGPSIAVNREANVTADVLKTLFKTALEILTSGNTSSVLLP